MATPITGGTAFDFGAAAQAPPDPPPAETTIASLKPSTATEPTGDTVKLSDGAQVRLLNSQGQTVAQIAVDTALSTKAVNSYLGISQPPSGGSNQ